MTVVLQISDLHLSEMSSRQVSGDYKATGIIPVPEQQNRLDLLRQSLGALSSWLRTSNIDLDAVVVCGDVALQHSDEGFAEFARTMEWLGDKKPDNDHIVVIPGNHDVQWATGASSHERYEKFLAHIRQNGYITPFLEGIDIDATSGTVLDGAVEPLLDLGDCVVVPINSSNYCGSRKRLCNEAEEAFRRAVGTLSSTPEALKEFEDLLNFDVARVSPAQMTALRTALTRYDSPADGGPVRIAAIHHQLLPVSPDEEFKAFESITNLGQLRQFFVAQEISAVLHGHKHRALTYIDEVAFPGEAAPRPNGYLVSSAGTVWGQQTGADEFARLILVDGKYPAARVVTVRPVPATPPGGEQTEPPVARRWTVELRTDRLAPRPFMAPDVDGVYERMMSYFEALPPETIVRNLVCVIEDGQSALRVPRSFPDSEGIHDKQKWLDDTVAWWQRPDPDLAGRGRRFNHGERIRRYVNGKDQIDEVVKAIKRSNGTTRGLVQIIDPVRDDMGDADQRIPSFFACQFFFDTQTNTLDCVGLFRKQQVRMWWPVNVAEVARMQKEVVEKLRLEDISNVKPGSITTFATSAHDGTNRPRVVVPRADRAAQDSPEVLWDIGFDLFFGEIGSAQARLEELFDDWRPTGEMEGDGSAVALRGMGLLSRAIAMYAARKSSPAGERLARQLENIHRANISYSENEERPQEVTQRQLRYTTWYGTINGFFREITEALEQLRAERSVEDATG